MPVVQMSAEFKDEFINIHDMTPEQQAKAYRLRSAPDSGSTRGKRPIDLGPGGGDHDIPGSNEQQPKRRRTFNAYY